MCFRILNEIHDNEKIISKPHLVYNAQFIIKTLFFLIPIVRISLRKSFFTQPAQISCRGFSFRNGKRRQLVFTKSKCDIAPFCNSRCILNGPGKVSQKRFHLFSALTIEFLIRKTESTGIIHRVSR